MGKLVLFQDDGTTRDVVLDKERITIGRRADNDLCLPFPAVSGEHASVVTIVADSFLEDLGSTNGTLVNGKAIVKHFLRDRDQIDIGRQRLVYLFDDDARIDGVVSKAADNQLLGLTEKVKPARRLPDVAVPALDAALQAPAAALTAASANPGDDRRRPAAAVAAAVRPGSGPDPSRAKPTSRSADQRLAAWAADWAAPTGDAGTGTIDTANLPPSSAAAESAGVAPTAEPRLPAPLVRVLSGPSQGRAVAFDKDELSVGRVGVQVAVVRRSGDGFVLVPVEGPAPPRINGASVPPEGAALHPGDTFEVAGVRLDLSLQTVIVARR